MKARYARAEKNVKDLNQSLELMKNESKKLLERTALAEKDLKYGHNELMYVLLVKERMSGLFDYNLSMPEYLIPIMFRSTGTKCKQLSKSLYKVEARAAGMLSFYCYYYWYCCCCYYFVGKSPKGD